MSDVVVPEIETGLDGQQRQRSHTVTVTPEQVNSADTDAALAAAMPDLTSLRVVLATRLAGLDAIVTSSGTPATVANVAQAQAAIRQLQQAIGTLATNQRDLAQFVRSLAINERRLIRKQRGDFTASD